MKTNKLSLKAKSIQFLLFALLMFLFAQCSKGPTGNNGLDGINFTHSVIYDVKPTSWVGDLNGYNASINVPEITNDIYNNGAVLVYRIIDTKPKSFNLLPYTYVDNALTSSMDFNAYIGSIELIYKEVYNGVNDTPVLSKNMSFKVVIIEGIPLTTLKQLVDVSDFNAVAKIMNAN